jgi:hypothetical protein
VLDKAKTNMEYYNCFLYGNLLNPKEKKIMINIKQVLRNFKFYQTFIPRPSQNSNTFFSQKSFKKYLKIYLNH